MKDTKSKLLLKFALVIFFSDRMSGVDSKPDENKAGKEDEPEGLMILTAADFKTFLSQTEHVIVMFYAPCK